MRILQTLGFGFVALSIAAPGLIAQDGDPQPLDYQQLPSLSRAQDHLSVSLFLGFEPFTLELDRYSVRSASAPHAGMQPVATYRGRLAEEFGRRVVASVRKGVLRAMVWRAGENEPWWIAPAEELGGDVSDKVHLVAHSRDVPASLMDVSCGVEDVGERFRYPDALNEPASYSSGTYTADVVIEADYEYFSHFGVLEDAEDAIEETINFSSAIYESTFGIRFEIASLQIWDTAADPYGDSPTNINALKKFKLIVNNNFAPDDWDLAQLFTKRTFTNGGSVLGMAYIDELCDEREVSWVKGGWPSLINRVHLTGHEFGHVFGASHCFGQLDCGTMGAPSAGPGGEKFGSQSIASISNNPDLLTCVDAAAPSSALPTASSLSVSNVEALIDGSATETAVLTGLDLSFAHQVDVGGDVLTLFDIDVASDTEVSVDLTALAPPTSLGMVSVTVLNGAGWSGSVPLTFVETNPPRVLVVEDTYYPGQFHIELGGRVNTSYQLLVSADPATTLQYGVQVLANPIFIEVGTLDGAGLGKVLYGPPTFKASYWLQVVSRDANQAITTTAPVEVFYFY
ncbi:MAG: hypothetical protein ACI9EF_001459 [Pseudohongiellaceae bacterium]|jgi:hypothetical protein